MNEIERHIRELALRGPGDTLDQRVLFSLHGSADVAVRDSDRRAQVFSAATDVLPVNSSTTNEPTRMRRGIPSGMIGGLVVALLIGIFIGNTLPSIGARFGGSPANRSTLMPADGSVLATENAGSGDAARDDEFPSRHPRTPELSQHLRDALQNQSTVGSQFVESVYLSAIDGAARWERQNGEKFDVTTHVSDRRFDMCRDCHRVGG